MIANSDFNLVAYAERVAQMSDAELLEEGKQRICLLVPVVQNDGWEFLGKCLMRMARPERFELPTFWFVARRSIQLS
jgi:hypothetical protein